MTCKQCQYAKEQIEKPTLRGVVYPFTCMLDTNKEQQEVRYNANHPCHHKRDSVG